MPGYKIGRGSLVLLSASGSKQPSNGEQVVNFYANITSFLIVMGKQKEKMTIFVL
jgi:hypothetical protein